MSNVVIPKDTIKWIALSLVALNIFTFLIGALVVPGFGFSGQQEVRLAPQGGQDNAPSRVSLDDVGAAAIGSADAPITIIEYSDFQCPFCRRFYETTLKQIETEYINKGQVRLEYRHFPLSFHPAAPVAAEAAECAGEQGKFWEVHDVIYDRQSERGTGTISFGRSEVEQWIASVDGLNVELVMQCMDSGKYSSRVTNDFSDGAAAGVSGTPSFFIGNEKNGYVLLVGAQPFVAFKQIIDEELTRV